MDHMLGLLLTTPPKRLAHKIDALSKQFANTQSPMKKHMHWIRDCRNSLGHEPPVMEYAQLATTEETVLETYEEIVCYLEVFWLHKQEADGLRRRIRQLEGQVRSRVRALEDQLRSRQHGNGGFASPQAHHYDSAGREHLYHQRYDNHYPHGRTLFLTSCVHAQRLSLPFRLSFV